MAPDEYAATLLGLSIVGDEAKAPLALIAKGLELRHEIADTRLEDVWRHGDGDGAFGIAIDEAGFIEIGK
jgi:hypothetical protein